MIIVVFFWLYCLFLILAFVLAIAPGFANWLPELDQIRSVYLTYPALALNAAVGAYLVHYFMALDHFHYRIYLILFFVSISVMIGSGASMAFEFTIAETDLFRLAFGEGPSAAAVMAIATWTAGWSARQFEKNFKPNSP